MRLWIIPQLCPVVNYSFSCWSRVCSHSLVQSSGPKERTIFWSFLFRGGLLVPCGICFIIDQIQIYLIYLFPCFYFSGFHFFLDSVVMVKLNCINKKACLINWNRETYTIYQQFIKKLKKYFPQIQFHFYQILFSTSFLDSILMIQKHL